MKVRSWLLSNLVCNQTELVHCLIEDLEEIQVIVTSNLPFYYSEKHHNALKKEELRSHNKKILELKESIKHLEKRGQEMFAKASANFSANNVSEVQASLTEIFNETKEFQASLTQLESYQEYDFKHCCWYLFYSDGIGKIFEALGFPLVKYAGSVWVGFTESLSNCFDENDTRLEGILDTSLRDELDDATIAANIIDHIKNGVAQSIYDKRPDKPILRLKVNHYYKRMPYTTNH